MRTSITPPEIDRRQAMRASEERELALRSALTALVKLPYHGALVPPAGPYVLVSDVHPIVLSALASSSSGDAGTGAEEGVAMPNIRLAVFDPEHYPEDAAAQRLQRLLDEPKDSSTIHFDEDTIPHGACSDPVHCDCMCPECWRLKVEIIRQSASPKAGPA